MGKKRSAHRSSARGSASSTSNAGSSSMGSASGGSVPSHLMGQTFSHPTGVPLRQGSFASAGGGGAGSGASAGGAGGSGGGLDSLSRQLASLSPAMLRELLAASGGLGDMGYNDLGYDDDLPPDMGPYASGSGMANSGTVSSGVMSGSLSGSISGGSIDLGGNVGNLSPEDAAQAQRYLQSIGQALTAQLSASGNNPPASSNGKVFGPPPPPPTGAPAGSATFSAGSMTLDLNSATGQGLTSQLEALSQLMMAQKDHANSILRNGHAAVDRSNVSEARKAEALEALDKLGESTRDHVANFQSLMGYMSSQGDAGSMATGSGTLPAYSSASASAGSSASASHYTNTSTNFGPADVDPSALPLFHELVRLTHSIAAAQESGDATAADDATNRLCEAVMRDPASMGALGAALSNPTGMAGMTALFQGMAVGAGAAGGPASATASGAGARGRGQQQSVSAMSSGAAVPPLPPPAGGFPPSSGPAAAAAAMAAFAGGGPPPPAADARDEAGAQAWLDYYDACLRAGGVAGGLREFEERARTGPGVGSGGARRDLPQDRPVDCPAEFEYDDGAATTTEEAQPTAEELQQLAEEEEARLKKKAERKREKKARQKERQKREAEAKAAEAAARKRERAVAAWRSRVVQACLAGDAKKMEVLAGESPYRNCTYDPSSAADGDGDGDGEERPRSRAEHLAQELGWFLPRCLQKYPPRSSHLRTAPLAANPAREALAKYVMATSFDAVLLQSPLKRNALHSAAYHDDAEFLTWVAEACNNLDDSSEERRSRQGYLEEYCQGAGWTPLHYAVAGGSESAVEVLLAAGADVRQTTLRGATAPDLAAMLQNGGAHGACARDAALVGEVVEARIHKASDAERAEYVRVLEAMGERLGDVAANGYSPPKEPQRQEASQREAGGEPPTTSATNKKSKKKKKQPQASASKSPSASSASVPAPESNSAPAPAAAGDDGALSDPVAVALLGMGFAPDQIRSAARALGGFDRAAADDMVVWILGGEGEGAAAGGSQGPATEAAEAPLPDTAPDADHQREGAADAEVLSRAQRKAAAKAQRAAEERAAQRRDARAAEERAAAKREERRRIRREWNERESARQAEEKRAKAAEAMERRRRAEMEKLLPPGMVPGAMGGAAPPISAGGRDVPMHHHHPGHHPGHGGGPPLTILTGGPKPARPKPGSHMGIPPAPAVRAPKILARPSNMQSHPVVGSQPLFAPVPTVVRAGAASPPRGGANARPYRPSGHRPQPTAILQKGGGMAAPHHPPARHPAPADYYRQQGQQSSSYGGGTHPNHPGPSRATPLAASASEHTAEANPMGTIRATAREFVPAGFATMNSTAQEFVPSLSAQTAAVPPSSAASPPPPVGGSASNDTSATDVVEPMSSLLHSLGGDGPAPPATSVPMREHDSTVPSAASSITGLSGLPSGTGEDPTSRVGSALTFESTSSATGAPGGMQATSILESIACGEDAPSSVGLWGGANTGNPGSSSLGLAGLNFSSFMGEQGNGGGGGNAAGGGTWGANTGGSGSIW